MQSESPDVRDLFHEKLDALLDECNLVTANAAPLVRHASKIQGLLQPTKNMLHYLHNLKYRSGAYRMDKFRVR